MSGWLLDTNVLSELRKTRCHPKVKTWINDQPSHTLFISVVTLAEIRFGIQKAGDPEFRHQLNLWLDDTLRPWFAGRVLEVDGNVLLRWCEMVEKGRKQNHTFSQPDLFLAATADLHNLCVVSRNVDDFKISGVPVLNPWKP